MSEFPNNPSDVSNQMGPSLADKLNAAHIFPNISHWTDDEPKLILKHPRVGKPFAPSLDTVGISTVGDEWESTDIDVTVNHNEMDINNYNLERENHRQNWDITVWGPGGKAFWNHESRPGNRPGGRGRWEDV